MGWIKTKTAKFIEDEIVALQFLSSNYSRTNAELLVFLRGGGEMKFMGEEAIELWEKYGTEEGETVPK